MRREPIPNLRLHLSVQGSATNYEAINFYHQQFGIQRAVMPRVLSLAQVEQLMKNTPVEIELFGFGGLCVMVEGRCALSSYVTGESPNTCGVCSPAKAVRWEQTPTGLESRLNGMLIDRYGEDENAGYPTLCKGRFEVDDETYYAIEEPTSLNTLEMLPEMMRDGHRRDQDRRPPAQPGLCRAGHQGMARRDRRRQARAAELHRQPGLDGAPEQSRRRPAEHLGAYNRPWK